MTWRLMDFGLECRNPGRDLVPVSSRRWLVGLMASLASSLVQAADIAIQPLLDTDRSVTGELLHHADGTPMRIEAVTLSLQPGDSTGWHCHGRPMFAYLLSGVLEVEYQGQGSKLWHAGDALMESMTVPHRGTNRGNEPVRILVLYIKNQMPGRLAMPAVEIDVSAGEKASRYACPQP